MLSRYMSLALATALAVALVGCGGGGGSKTATPRTTATQPLRTFALSPKPSSSGSAGRGTLPPTALPLETSSAAPQVAPGLQIIDLSVGNGEEARAGDIVYVNYRETLSDGTVVDENVLDNTSVPVRWNLRQGLIIQGLVDGVPGMKVGGKRRLIIPPDLAYGAQGSGAVPPDATVTFDFDLVEVRHP